MSLATAPEFRNVDANAPEFREALTTWGTVSDGISTRFSAYSHHSHDGVTVMDGQVLFEERRSDGQLKLYPLNKAEAMRRGLPSCWAFTPDENGKAKIHVLRYADNALFEGVKIDVNSAEFLAELQKMGDALVAANIHDKLELTVIGHLFAPPAGMLTRERTFSGGHHLVDFVPIPPEIMEGDWRQAACWSLDGERKPVVTGVCDADGDIKHR